MILLGLLKLVHCSRYLVDLLVIVAFDGNILFYFYSA